MQSKGNDGVTGARGRHQGGGRRRGRHVLIGWLTIATVLGATAGGVAPRSTEAAWVGVVTGDGAQVYAEPGWWADLIGALPGGEWVEVWRGPTGDGWYQIAFAGGGGWVSGGALSFEAGTAGGTADAGTADGGGSWDAGGGGGGTNAWVDTDALNVRGGASTHAEVIDQLGYGAGVSVTGGEVNGFVPIAYGGGAGWGWVSSGYLRWDGPPAGGPPAAAAPVAVAGGERWIDVNRSAQQVTLMVGAEPIASFWGALGYDQSNDGFYATAVGTYYVYEKAGDLAWTPWAQAYIEDWVAFDPARQNGFHSYMMDEWGNVLPNGAGPTGGCVAVDPWGSQQIYDFAEYGMRVEVHW